MKTTSSSNSLHLDHLFKVAVLHGRSISTSYSSAVRRESKAEVLRYRDQGISNQKEEKMGEPMTQSGFC